MKLSQKERQISQISILVILVALFLFKYIIQTYSNWLICFFVLDCVSSVELVRFVKFEKIYFISLFVN